MKANKILLGMFAALAMTGCKDSFLEVTSPTDTFIDEYYTTKTSLDEALVPPTHLCTGTTMALPISTMP